MDNSHEIKTLEEIKQAEAEVEWLLTAARSEAAAIIEAARAEAATILSSENSGLDEVKQKMRAEIDGKINGEIDELLKQARDEAQLILSLSRGRTDSWAAELEGVILPVSKQE